MAIMQRRRRVAKNPTKDARLVVKLVLGELHKQGRSDLVDWMTVNSTWVYATAEKHLGTPTTPTPRRKRPDDEAVARLRTNLFSVISDLSA